MNCLLILIGLIGLTVNANVNAEESSNKKETLDFIVNTMHNCSDGNSLPNSVELKGSILFLSYVSNVTWAIPLPNVKYAEINVSSHGALDIYMKEGKTLNITGLPVTGKSYSKDEKLISCSTQGPQKMDFEMKLLLVKAFKHLSDFYN